MRWMVTIDNGSTFTDGCLFADGQLHAVKTLTTPYDLMRCFVEVFRALAREAGLPNEGELLRRVEEVRYSTTSGTNSLLVRRGSRVGAIVGPEGLPDLYGVRAANPGLVEAIVGDRVASLALGEVSDEEADARILSAVRTLLGRGAQWVVVSLPSPRGAAEERRVKSRLLALLPGHLLGAVPVLFSRELCADPDDARRTAAAILNGFLHREMARFLYHADGWVRERHVAEPLRILRNDGGCGRVAKTTAVKTLDSGPRGGLAGAARIAAVADRPRLVTLDVGGTSSDIGIVESGEPAIERFGTVHGLRLSFSFPELRTAALGGGSVFRVEAGTIRIGPESAGALPGPASFGRGGEDPTLTDAAFVLGHLDPTSFAGGSIAVRLDLAERAILERIARPLRLSDAPGAAQAMIAAFADRLAAEILRACERRSVRPPGDGPPRLRRLGAARRRPRRAAPRHPRVARARGRRVVQRSRCGVRAARSRASGDPAALDAGERARSDPPRALRPGGPRPVRRRRFRWRRPDRAGLRGLERAGGRRVRNLRGGRRADPGRASRATPGGSRRPRAGGRSRARKRRAPHEAPLDRRGAARGPRRRDRGQAAARFGQWPRLAGLALVVGSGARGWSWRAEPWGTRIFRERTRA